MTQLAIPVSNKKKSISMGKIPTMGPHVFYNVFYFRLGFAARMLIQVITRFDGLTERSVCHGQICGPI